MHATVCHSVNVSSYCVYIADEDYNATRITVDVPAGVSTQSFAINIIDNDKVECDEVFSVTIEPVTTCGVTTGDVVTSNVTIIDDDGEGKIFSLINIIVFTHRSSNVTEPNTIFNIRRCWSTTSGSNT